MACYASRRPAGMEGICTLEGSTVTPPNLTVAINGPSYAGVDVCTTYTWTASVSGGTSPYAYQWTWNGAAVSTGSSYSRQICPGVNYSSTINTVALTVTDSASRTGSASEIRCRRKVWQRWWWRVRPYPCP